MFVNARWMQWSTKGVQTLLPVMFTFLGKGEDFEQQILVTQIFDKGFLYLAKYPKVEFIISPASPFYARYCIHQNAVTQCRNCVVTLQNGIPLPWKSIYSVFRVDTRDPLHWKLNFNPNRRQAAPPAYVVTPGLTCQPVDFNLIIRFQRFLSRTYYHHQ